MTLYVGVSRNLIAKQSHIGAPQYLTADYVFEYLESGGAPKHTIDIVPGPISGHSGICFEAAGSPVNGTWQISHEPWPNPTQQQLFWYVGGGVIFHPDGKIQTERWAYDYATGKSINVDMFTIGKYTKGKILRVTCERGAPIGGWYPLDIRVYETGPGGAMTLIAQSPASFRVPNIGGKVGVFNIGPGNIQVTPASYSW